MADSDASGLEKDLLVAVTYFRHTPDEEILRLREVVAASTMAGAGRSGRGLVLTLQNGSEWEVHLVRTKAEEV